MEYKYEQTGNPKTQSWSKNLPEKSTPLAPQTTIAGEEVILVFSDGQSYTDPTTHLVYYANDT